MSDRRRLGIGAALLALVTGLLATDGLAWGEAGATERVNDLPGPVIDVLELVMQLGTRPAILLIAAVAVVVTDADWRRVLAVVVLSGGVAWAGSALAKDVVERPRPTAYSDEVVVRGGSSGFGWPSSHTAIAAASLTAAALVARRRPQPAIALATVVGLGRMAVGVHLPLDVLGGLGLGVCVAVLVVEVADR